MPLCMAGGSYNNCYVVLLSLWASGHIWRLSLPAGLRYKPVVIASGCPSTNDDSQQQCSHHSPTTSQRYPDCCCSGGEPAADELQPPTGSRSFQDHASLQPPAAVFFCLWGPSPSPRSPALYSPSTGRLLQQCSWHSGCCSHGNSSSVTCP
jgi:hypothetical protein